ncbi:putative protein phosphatase 2C 55-like [Capsicum annuum]|uniref:uncharacterized protein LOC107869996 isoform X1 n=1 Tax=Capsicum annuum TaxID=4072 RepID=UPI001FB17A91|nr:uncharacterized protein LOC107869996 isoform X1 [Capsicum annuum]KAF3656655.1 putative protein phosphatase 2C 55-like [Capsicum annuum]
MRRTNRKCRLWWPTNLCSLNQLSNLHSYAFLFGWFISSSEASFDIVVAFACDESALVSMTTHMNLERILQGINRKMPVLLQDKSKFSLLGYYAADFSSNGQLLMVRGKGNKHINSTSKKNCFCAEQHAPGGKRGRWRCGCHKLDAILEQCRAFSLKDNIWAQIVCDSSQAVIGKVGLIPKVHHIHRKGEAIFQLDVHVLFYGVPVFGGHHHSLGFKSPSEQVTNHCKKPEWVKDLNRKQPYLDLDTVILSVNTANAAKVFTEANNSAKRSRIPFHFFCMFSVLTWQLLAVLLASFSTILYVIVQSFHICLIHVSHSYIYVALEKVFCNTCKNLEIGCCHLLYWPVILKDYGLRSQSCVEYAEKAAFHRHSMWTSLIVDLLLGNFLGIILWSRARAACAWVSSFSENVTNYLLRTGCVWLMGNPAGFKLNTELAGVLGTISLIAIQIWSTLWWLLGFFLIHLIKVVAVFGSLFGLTAAAALIIDTISLATTHVSALQWLLTLLYSWQIQAVDALWRLFRGRKWNPLRQRLDSYAYSVEQHVVGSLLFTPLLLLLPTTSLFYIFFTIMKTTISFVCIAIQFGIAIIHATPYIKIFFWFTRRKRFPSGLWFEIILCQRNAINSAEVESVDKTASGSENSRHCKSAVLVSFLHSNYLSLRQVVWPHYRNVFSDVSRSSIALSAYGVLTGKRSPTAPKIGLPPTLPWMSIPYKEYWRLCHEAVLGCRQDCNCKSHQ